MRLKDKVAVVTGSAQGLGKAIVTDMVKEGAKVVIVDVNEEGALAVMDEIKEMGGEAIVVKCDVTDRIQVEALVQATIDAFGKVDILVNNAGVIRDSTLKKMSDEQWDTVITVNLKSVFLCTQAFSGYMTDQGWGRIINLSSIAGTAGNFGQTNYSATKAGIIGITKTLAKELGRKGVTVNAIAPGFMNTEMTKSIPEEVVQRMLKNIPIGRMGEPSEVAAAAVYLSSNEAGFINGVTLNINGGEYCS